MSHRYIPTTAEDNNAMLREIAAVPDALKPDCCGNPITCDTPAVSLGQGEYRREWPEGSALIPQSTRPQNGQAALASILTAVQAAFPRARVTLHEPEPLKYGAEILGSGPCSRKIQWRNWFLVYGGGSDDNAQYVWSKADSWCYDYTRAVEVLNAAPPPPGYGEDDSTQASAIADLVAACKGLLAVIHDDLTHANQALRMAEINAAWAAIDKASPNA